VEKERSETLLVTARKRRRWDVFFILRVLGDAIFAFFGAPRSVGPHHAVMCVEAALKQQEKLQDLMAKWAAQGWWDRIMKESQKEMKMNRKRFERNILFVFWLLFSFQASVESANGNQQRQVFGGECRIENTTQS
jgi:hypothetical protein